MSSRSLPAQPDLAELKLQAKQIHRQYRDRIESAAARVLAHHPRLQQRTLLEAREVTLALADAQLVIAREYGFDTWNALKRYVEIASQCAELRPHPRFGEALSALDAGDLDHLRALVTADASLVRARGFLDPPPNYFSAATLLHCVAGNPFRSPLPTNVVDVARFLIRAGADVNAKTLAPTDGATTMDLIITSAHASEVGRSGPLMDLLLSNGAELNLHLPDVLHIPLANHAPAAAEKMIELGAKADICAAGALGHMDLLRGCFDEHDTLTTPVRRRSKILSTRDAIGLALLFAYVNGRLEAVDFLLEKDGNWNMTGVNNGTALHRAASASDLAMVKRLFTKGADLNDRNNPFNATPLSWAEHFRQMEVFDWMCAHCPIDIHDAVCFGLSDHVRARVAEDPDSVNRLIDQWSIPRSSPLHQAAHTRRAEIAKLLLDNGAQVNALAGDGRTALDIAEDRAATEVAKLLRDYGGLHSADV